MQRKVLSISPARLLHFPTYHRRAQPLSGDSLPPTGHRERDDATGPGRDAEVGRLDGGTSVPTPVVSFVVLSNDTAGGELIAVTPYTCVLGCCQLVVIEGRVRR